MESKSSADIHSFDYLVILHASLTDEEIPNKDFSQLDPYTIADMKIPHIVNLGWAIYSIKEKKLSDDRQVLIKYHKYAQLSDLTKKRTNISDYELGRKGVSLGEALRLLNSDICMNYLMKSKTICITTFGSDLIQKILPLNAREVGIKLQHYLYTYFDICSDFWKFYYPSCEDPRKLENLKKMDDYLAFLKLASTPLDSNILKVEIRTLARIINKMNDEGFIYSQPKVLNTNHQLINGEKAKTDVKVYKKWNNFIRSKSPEPFRNPLKAYFIRLRGLPYLSREPEIIEFLRGIRVYKEDICCMYDLDGKFSGEAYIQLHNEADMKEALSYNLSEMGDRYIEIFETNENEFNKAKVSKKITVPNLQDSPWAALFNEKYGIVKMRGLPYSSTESDIRDFFKNLTILRDGIKRTIVNGKASSECYVFFETKEEASLAMSFNNDRIGSRFIELFPATPREFHSWMTVNFGESGAINPKDHLPNIPTDKRRCCLVARGLPFNCQKADIQRFFDGFKMGDNDIHLLPGQNGKFSGDAVICFEDEIEAEKAMKLKNLCYLENRYIELMEYR